MRPPMRRTRSDRQGKKVSKRRRRKSVRKKTLPIRKFRLTSRAQPLRPTRPRRSKSHKAYLQKRLRETALPAKVKKAKRKKSPRSKFRKTVCTASGRTRTSKVV